MLVDKKRIIVALDYADKQQAMEMVARLDPALCRVKIGKELFTCGGPQMVESVQQAGFDVFLDLKFHDIPNTVAAAVQAAAELGVWMVNVHACGGIRMMEAAKNILAKCTGHSPLLIGVTVLTSMEQKDLSDIGLDISPKIQVERLAKLAKDVGLDGVVCSAQEASALRTLLGESFILVTPGIRPKNAVADDQRRIVTPIEAINAGSNYLVVGRPVTMAPSPIDALSAITLELGAN